MMIRSVCARWDLLLKRAGRVTRKLTPWWRSAWPRKRVAISRNRIASETNWPRMVSFWKIRGTACVGNGSRCGKIGVLDLFAIKMKLENHNPVPAHHKPSQDRPNLYGAA